MALSVVNKHENAASHTGTSGEAAVLGEVGGQLRLCPQTGPGKGECGSSIAPIMELNQETSL